MSNKKETFFSSDYHLGHNNIIKYDGRPFKDIAHHDEAIIASHNMFIEEDDDFYFLGDFSFNDKKTEEYLQRLNGNKFFIKGNHDKRETIRMYERYGTYLGELAEVVVDYQRIVLCHYAMRVWNRSHRNVWHLYGHSHGSLPDDKHSLSFDIGINCHNYKPLSFREVEKIMSNKEFFPIDHHKPIE